MKIAETWPSLRDQLLVAERLFGSPGPARLSKWLAHQADLVDNGEFARQFHGDVRLAGSSPADYAHRYIRTARGDLLGGIRFYSSDAARPFVEVVAHSFDDLDALAACVHDEWSPFGVRYLRLRTRPGRLAGRPGVVLDQSIHAARGREMTADDARVTLRRFADAQQAIDIVTDRYTRLALTDPVLSNNLSPATPEDLRDWHARHQVWAIARDADTIGVLAVAPGAVGWITGQVINEEVIAVPYAGQGFASSAQRAWVRGPFADNCDLLIGTIDRHNHISRATAVRAGRPSVLDDVFLALRDDTHGRRDPGT